ncbi:hypothetical protein VV11_002345 [Trichodesmium erythraeum 21-75]|nr:hypothetical protein [Trichodesmium erythraeum 21-75]
MHPLIFGVIGAVTNCVMKDKFDVPTVLTGAVKGINLNHDWNEINYFHEHSDLPNADENMMLSGIKAGYELCDLLETSQNYPERQEQRLAHQKFGYKYSEALAEKLFSNELLDLLKENYSPKTVRIINTQVAYIYNHLEGDEYLTLNVIDKIGLLSLSSVCHYIFRCNITSNQELKQDVIFILLLTDSEELIFDILDNGITSNLVFYIYERFLNVTLQS